MTQAIIGGQSAPQVGDTAPDFSFENYSGETVRLSEMGGDVRLLAFWFPACGPCRGELPRLEEIYQEFKPRGFEIIALDVTGDAEGGRKFVNSKNLSYIFLDANMDIASAYGVTSTPTLILLDRDGRIVETFIGHHYGLEKLLQELLPSLEASLFEVLPAAPGAH